MWWTRKYELATWLDLSVYATYSLSWTIQRFRQCFQLYMSWSAFISVGKQFLHLFLFANFVLASVSHYDLCQLVHSRYFHHKHKQINEIFTNLYIWHNYECKKRRVPKRIIKFYINNYMMGSSRIHVKLLEAP